MKSYEGVFIFPPETTGGVDRKAQESQLEDMIKKCQGKITERQEWGKRPLGYMLQKYKEGYIFVLDFQMDTLKVSEFRKLLELHEGLMKYMLTVKPKKAIEKAREKLKGTGSATESKTAQTVA